MRLFFDVTRTLLHARRRTLTGIDRVEQAYVRYLLSGHSPTSDLWFVLNTPVGQVAITPKRMHSIFDAIELRQRGEKVGDESSTYDQLLHALREPVGTNRTVPLRLCSKVYKERDDLRGVATLVMTGGLRFKRLISDRTPAIYLNTSHILLDKPACFRWLDKREIFAFFLIHDLIPIEYPEFCIPGSESRHVSRMETVLSRASGIITNSNFTRESFLRFASGRSVPRIEVVPLANTIREATNCQLHKLNLSSPYFIHVGTIEGRKNIGHLLNVWREVINRMGSHLAPRLVLIGRRGWECDNVVSILDRSKELANHVIEVADIGDYELKRLMFNASGLITVSLTEGYGLPPVEALQIGTPVIASDIPAHREILGDACHFVSPYDGEALANLVVKLAVQGGQRREYDIEPLSWQDHVGRSFAFIQSISGNQAKT